MAGREHEIRQTRPDTPDPASPDRNRLIGVGLLLVAGLGLFWLPLRGVRLAATDRYGLVSVLPIATLAGAGLLVAAFFLTLALDRPYRALLAVQLVVTAFVLHGLAPALGEPARSGGAALVEQIARTGCAQDARLCRPGFYALVAFLTRAAGFDGIEPIVRWAPVALELLYVVALFLIMRALSIGWRATWLAGWLLVAASWADFSPQGFGLLLYLLFAGLLLNWFRSAPSSVAMYFLTLALFVVATASDQLTSYVMLFAATALVLVRRCVLRTLPVLLGVVLVSYLGFVTTPRAEGLLAGLRALVRIADAPEHWQPARVVLAAAVVTLAVLGLVRRRLRRFDDRVAAALLVAPLLALALQSFGVAGALRVYLFVLPGACLPAAYLFFPVEAGRQTRAVAAAGVCGAFLVGASLFIRYGDENVAPVEPGRPGIGHTPWTPLGLVAAMLLVIILVAYQVTLIAYEAAREIVRPDLREREHPVLWPLLVTVVPLAAVLIFVVLERLDRLGS